MKRTPRVLITLLAAALTVGSLVAFVGPQKWHHHRYKHGQAMEKCNDAQPTKQQESGTQPK